MGTILQTTQKQCYSSISHEKHKGTQHIRKFAYRFTYTTIGISIIYDAFNEFQTVGGATRFVRSLKIAVANSFDYSYNLYGLSEESIGYDKVSKLLIIISKN